LSTSEKSTFGQDVNKTSQVRLSASDNPFEQEDKTSANAHAIAHEITLRSFMSVTLLALDQNIGSILKSDFQPLPQRVV
jgi:hypothetical protein